MKILVSGSNGFIGSALVASLTENSHDVTRLVRRVPRHGEIRWDPEGGTIDADGIEGMDAVVHLAAESIAAGRWTAKQKARIRDSRVNGTRLLVETLAQMEQPPGVLACASSDVYYGDRGDEVLSEDSGPGTNFLAGVTEEWEAQTAAAAEAGIRVVNMRFGMVIGPTVAGVAGRFKKGLGGKLGDGSHYISWVTLDDAIGAIHHVLTTEALEGPLNIAASNPVTNADFTKTLGRGLGRPTLLRRPAFLMRLLMGEMAEIELISVRMDSTRLMDSGFRFLYPELEGAMRSVLGRP